MPCRELVGASSEPAVILPPQVRRLQFRHLVGMPLIRGLVLASCVLLQSRLSAAGQVLPDELTVGLGEIENVGTDVTLVLTKRSVRSDAYALYVQTPEGLTRVEPFPVSTYRGYVKGDPAMRVNANIEPGGVLNANFSEGRAIVGRVRDRKVTVPPGRGTPSMSAGNEVVPVDSITPRPSPTPHGHILPPVPMRRVLVNLVVAPECTATCSSLEAAVSRAEQRINDTEFVFARDVGVAWEIDRLVMGVPGTMKGYTVSADQAEQPAKRRMAVTFCKAGQGNRGGHAYASGLGADGNALVHEAGHSFGAPHGLDRDDAMKGCHAFFGPNNTRLIIKTYAKREEKDFPAVVYSGVLPPHVLDDIVCTDVDAPVTIDVLENDFDGNGDALSISSAGPASEKGGSVTLTDDRLQVIYTPPPGFVGTDRFEYTVVDGSGAASRTGEVIVNVVSGEVAAHLDFENLVMVEARGRGNAGFTFPNRGPVGGAAVVLFFRPVLVDGVRGKAVFNGINSGWGPRRTYDFMHQINVPGIGDPGPGSMSVSIWVLYPKLRLNMLPFVRKVIPSTSGVVIGKGAVKYCGHNVPSTGWAIVHLDGYKGFKFLGQSGDSPFDLQTSEQIRANTWYHLAMVIDRREKRLRAWVNNEEVTESTTTSDIADGNIVDASELRIYNSVVWQWWHSFPAVIDELKVFNTALTREQVAELYAEGRDAVVPDLTQHRRNEKKDVEVKRPER